MQEEQQNRREDNSGQSSARFWTLGDDQEGNPGGLGHGGNGAGQRGPAPSALPTPGTCWLASRPTCPPASRPLRLPPTPTWTPAS